MKNILKVLSVILVVYLLVCISNINNANTISNKNYNDFKLLSASSCNENLVFNGPKSITSVISSFVYAEYTIKPSSDIISWIPTVSYNTYTIDGETKELAIRMLNKATRKEIKLGEETDIKNIYIGAEEKDVKTLGGKCTFDFELQAVGSNCKTVTELTIGTGEEMCKIGGVNVSITSDEEDTLVTEDVNFKLFNGGGCLDTYISDHVSNNGTFSINNLAYGTYSLMQVDAPEGFVYDENNNCKDFTIDANNQEEVKFSLKNNGIGQITSFLYFNAMPYYSEEARFSLYEYKDSICESKIDGYTNLQMDSESKSIVFDNLEAGKLYCIRLDTIPSGYTISESNRTHIVVAKYHSINIFNIEEYIELTDFTILKRINYGTSDVAFTSSYGNVVFDLYKGFNCDDSELIKSIPLEATGSIKLEDLIKGKNYSYKEKEVSEGYIIDNNCHNFTAGEVKTEKVNNTPYATIKIINIDSENTEEELSSTFGIYDDENCTTISKDIDNNELINLPTFSDNNTEYKLEYNKLYYLCQLTIPNGYKVSLKPVKFSAIKLNQNVVFENNKPIIGINVLNASDLTTILNDTKIVIKNNTSLEEKEINTFPNFIHLDLNTSYSLREVLSQEGYIKYDTEIDFEVNDKGIIKLINENKENYEYSNDTNTLNIYNDPIKTININIVNKEKNTKEVLQNIAFKLYSCKEKCNNNMEKNAFLSSYITDESGNIDISQLSYNQNYCLVEADNDMYQKSPDPICFYINEDDKIVLENQTDYVDVTKTTINIYNEIIKINDLGLNNTKLTVISGSMFILFGMYILFFKVPKKIY